MSEERREKQESTEERRIFWQLEENGCMKGGIEEG